MSTDEIRTTHTIIPAAPGWYVAKFNDYSYERPYFDCHPIVAWEVEHGQVLDGYRNGTPRWSQYRLATPVLPCGLSDGFETFKCGPGVDWALKSPDGKHLVVSEEGCEVLDEDHALAWFVAQHKERERAADRANCNPDVTHHLQPENL